MLAELAAANAAFDVIKQTIANGQEIYAAGQQMAEYFGLKREIQRKAHEHGYKSDLEAFMASEQLKAQEYELKQMMIYQGRPNMWDDWLRFQHEMVQSRKKERLEQVRARLKRKKMIVDTILITVTLIVGFSAIAGFVAIIL